MHIQRTRIAASNYSWLVIDDNGLPIAPIQEFVRHLEFTEKSPNTIRAYAHHLKLFWEFLDDERDNWHAISINHLARFIHWLRSKDSQIICFTSTSKRAETTVNSIMTCLSSFYRYHKQLGNTQVELNEPSTYATHQRYRSFLHHIHKHNPIYKKIISLKKTHKMPKTLSKNQIEVILAACLNTRDRLLIALLYETGLRIGQALGLQHEDIQSWDNVIQIIPREHLINGARTKSRKPYIVHVSPNLMELYTTYINEFLINEPLHQHVFINLKTCEPLKYQSVRSLFNRLFKKTKIEITPHMFRHTHATELIRQGWEAHLVQKRLGHVSIQTTLDIYSHLDTQDLKNAYEDYLLKRSHDAKK